MCDGRLLPWQHWREIEQDEARRTNWYSVGELGTLDLRHILALEKRHL
jgi:hypothetical protein